MLIKDRLVHTFEFGVAVVGYLVSQEGDPSSALDWNFRYVISETPERDVARLRKTVGYPGPVAHVGEVTPSDPSP